MFEKELPARPNLEHYKKQAKDLAREFGQDRIPEALHRLQRNHPRFHTMTPAELLSARCSLTDAQLVLAREHGFQSWPKFAHHLETLQGIERVASLVDPVAAFLEVATIPQYTGHTTGTLEPAERILARYPEVAASNMFTAAVLGDDATVRGIVAGMPGAAQAKGGALGWDPLTYLCFSRYLRLDTARSEAFVRTARALLEAGASANTGWYETIDQPIPRQILESAIYGAAAVARHAGLTRLLLEYGVDPALRITKDGVSVTAIAARRGRGDVLALFAERGIALRLSGVDQLIAACALGDKVAIGRILVAEPHLLRELLADGGMLLSEFAGNGNLEGVRCLLDLGVAVDSVHAAGDGYWDVAKGATALHVAAWRACHEVVGELIARGAPVNALDGKGRTALMLAVKACVDSYWKSVRKPDSVKALLEAGAVEDGIAIPTGYDAIDELLRQYAR